MHLRIMLVLVLLGIVSVSLGWKEDLNWTTKTGQERLDDFKHLCYINKS